MNKRWAREEKTEMKHSTWRIYEQAIKRNPELSAYPIGPTCV
jgi:hypothetical protein